jgi:putative FmdB family regulatory protein
MPTYEYKCEGCGHQFEEFQSMSEPALEKCPECKKKKLRRLFGTGAAILFKGSGFYETDYRSESYKSAAKADKEPSRDSGKDSGGAAKSDTGGTSGTNGTAKPDSGSSGKKGGAKSSKSKPSSSDD